MKKSITKFKTLSPILLSGFSILGANAQQKAEEATVESPNLIYIISDQLRLSALSCMGNKVISTPNMDRLASEGVIFTRAYSQCPVSVPSRSSMLTGNSLCNTGILGNGYAYETSTSSNPSILTGKEPIFSTDTYDEVLAKNGYDCEYYGKWHSPERKAYVYSNRPIGCAGITSVPVLGIGLSAIYTAWWKAELGVTSAPNFKTGALTITSSTTGAPKPTTDLWYMPDPEDCRYSNPTGNDDTGQTFGEILIDSLHTESNMESDEVIATIEKNKNVKFSVHCSFGPPHPPFVVAKPYYGSLKQSDMPIPANYFVNSASSTFYNVNELQSPYFSATAGNSKMAFVQNIPVIQTFQARYYEMVKEIDDKLGKILKKLDELGLTNKTMIVFCADHGEMLGSHGMNSKNVFFDESVRVPLIIRYPDKIAAGKRISTPVSLIDIRPTIEDYMGLPAYKCDGKTLRPFIEDTYDKSQEYFTVSEWTSTSVPGYMVRNSRYKLMIGQTAAANSIDGFYDLKTDSLEQNNLYKISPLSPTTRENAEKTKVQLVKWLKKVNSPNFYSVKARAIGKKYSTYALYKNDVAKINGANITALTGLPTGVSYRILPNDTIEITVTNVANTGVVNISSTVSGATKTLSFEILPAIDFTITSINSAKDIEQPFLIKQSGNNISVSSFSVSSSNPLLQLYNLQGILIKEIKMKNNLATFSTENLAKGVYIIRANQNSIVYSEKLIVK